MAYHGGYNYWNKWWKSQFTATLKHIDNLYYIRPMNLVFTSGDDIRIDSMILLSEDCSSSPFTEHPRLVKDAHRHLMSSLLRIIKRL